MAVIQKNFIMAPAKPKSKKELLAEQIAAAVGAGREVAVETVDFSDPGASRWLAGNQVRGTSRPNDLPGLAFQEQSQGGRANETVRFGGMICYCQM